MYHKLKKQNGEAFAKAIRNYHNGILEIPNLDVMLRFAGREAAPLIPYLISLLTDQETSPAPDDPFALLKKAGYNAFHADTLEKQNSIRRYFANRELLCTFNDAARHKNFHIVHAVKEGAEKLNRADFQGKEERQDAYGTSVISIQMMKGGGFISIKNRYNHAVTNCDNTFNSNPDNIINGLSEALKSHFNVDFTASKTSIPNGYAIFDEQIFQYHTEKNNIYYGDQAWVENGKVKVVNQSAGDALFDGFLFNNKTKTLQKIDQTSPDSFADDFNACYGGRSGLHVKNGHLMLGDERLIGAEESRIKTISLSELTTAGDYCLCEAEALTHFSAPSLITMGNDCLLSASALTHFSAPSLITMGDYCLANVHALTYIFTPKLKTAPDPVWELLQKICPQRPKHPIQPLNPRAAG